MGGRVIAILPLLRWLRVPRRKCVSTLLMVGGVSFLLLLLATVQVSIWVLTGSGFTLTSLSNEELRAAIQPDTKGQNPFGLHGNHLSQSNGLPEGAESIRNESKRVISRCHRLDTPLLFYIRIPKCASTSFVDLLKKIKRANFELLFDPSGAFDWDSATTAKVAGSIKKSLARATRVVYARHFYHVDFKPFGLSDYTYITIVREPVSRLVSSYLYYHFSSKGYIQAMLKREHRNETIADCIAHQHNGCTSNWMTKYFCGNAQFCKRGDSLALRTAKANLEGEFIAVGLLEEMELTLSVFRQVLPSYFVRLNPKAEAVKSLNKNERSMELSAEVLAVVRAANSADIELYDFAKKLLHRKARDCGIVTTA